MDKKRNFLLLQNDKAWAETFLCEKVFLFTNLSFENAGAEFRVGCHR